MPMRVAVFAAGEVGRRVVSLFSAREAPLACVVLHVSDPQGLNESILAEARGEGSPPPVVVTGPGRGDEVARFLADLSVDLGVLAWWPAIVPETVLQAVGVGFLNFHPSLLPWNRGKDPNFWAIVDGTPFGVTIHWVDSGVDTGDTAFQAELDVTWEDTGASLYRRAVVAILDLFAQRLDDILAGRIPRRPQDEADATSHRRAELEPASEIRLDEPLPARSLLNLLRARTFPPHPAAWFVDDGVRYEVRVQITRSGDPPGSHSDDGA